MSLSKFLRSVSPFRFLLTSRVRSIGSCRRRPRRLEWANRTKAAARHQIIETLEPRILLAIDSLVISEFLADNNSGKQDHELEYSDWIEIHNPTDTAISLDGWFLTDDEDNLTKWEVPDIAITAGGYEIIFASGKDVHPRRQEPHTNFNLSSSGEYLALVHPDQTVAHEFRPQYPRQYADISYGLAIDGFDLLARDAVADIFVPLDNSLGTDWTGVDFQTDSSQWITGTIPVGFGINVPDLSAPGFTVRQVFSTEIISSVEDAEALLDGQAVADETTVEGIPTINFHDGGPDGHFVEGNIAYPGGLGNNFAVRAEATLVVETSGEYTFGMNIDDGARLTIDGQMVAVESNGSPRAHDVIGTPITLATGSHTLEFVMYQKTRDTEVELYVAEGSHQDFNEEFHLLGDSSSIGLDVFVVASSTDDLTDIEAELSGINTSAYLRIPFNINENDLIDSLSLQMQYNDGFVAYLNSTEIARSNSPEFFRWDSQATAARTAEQSLIIETFDISAHINLLTPGENVLAIHALTNSLEDSSFLVSPHIIGSGLLLSQPHYFDSPTPGLSNPQGLVGLVEDTRFSIDRGFFDEPFQVEISSNTLGADIRYTTDGSRPSESHGTLYSGPIEINTTTNLRAIAYKEGYLPTDIDTHTYLFVDDIIQQPAEIAGFPFGGSKWAGGNVYVPQDSEMDPQIVNNPAYSDLVDDSLLSIPSMSITTDIDGVFTESGWYDGEDIERPVSVEILYPDQPSGNNQVNAGIESHSHDRLKRSLRLNFRREYGDAEFETDLFINAPLNGDTAVSQVDRIILRGGNNRSWARTWNPDKTAYTIDQFYRDSQIAMSGYGMRGNFVHLYINGVYWGLYNPVERADTFYSAEYFGGDDEDWFAVNHGGSLSGDSTRWNYLSNTLVNRDMSINENYAELREYLDVEAFADYLIISWWTAVSDWPQNNWYGGNRNESSSLGPTPFRFFAWDGEWSWGQGGQSSSTGQAHVHSDFRQAQNGGSPIPRLWHAVRRNDEFMMMFTDRVFKHLYHDGALTEENAKQRWTTLTEYLRDAVIAESARWGDSMESDGDPTRTRDGDWQREVNRILGLMTGNNDSFLSAVQKEGYYPAFDPPAFNQQGGIIQPGFQVTLESSRAVRKVYYTIDGTDPRLPGGEVSPSAVLYETPIQIDKTTEIRTRGFNNGWSALNAANFIVNPVTSEQLAITEILYNPVEPNADELAQLNLTEETADANLFEFIELQNISEESIDLSGTHFVTGISFNFTGSDVNSLAPSERVVVVKDLAAFEVRYGTEINVAGQFDSGTSLSNGGERLVLETSIGDVIHDLNYDDRGAWPDRADGRGSSLEIIDVFGDPDDGNNWRSSTEFGGTPGAAGMGVFMDVVVNEVLANSDGQEQDRIELLNTSESEVDISGWFISDSNANYKKFRIPDGTIIPAGGFLLFDESDIHAGGDIGFLLNGSRGDDIWLLASDENDRLIRFADHAEFGPSESNVSFGRIPDGSGDLVPNVTITFGSPNGEVKLGDVIISEIMFNPADEVAGEESTHLEYIELYNRSSSDVDLTDWRLRRGIDMEFDPGTTIGAAGTLVVISFNPDKLDNVDRLTEFRAAYGIDEMVTIVGGYGGRLENVGELIELQQPGELLEDDPSFIPHIVSDHVRYEVVPPWPQIAADSGDSLHRTEPEIFGNYPSNWLGLAANPGETIFISPDEKNLIVKRVLVSNSSWSEQFQSQFDLGGFELPGGPGRFAPLPWADLDQVSVVFNTDAVIDQSDLMLTGINTADYAVSDFTYDTSSHKATWTLAESFNTDKVFIALSETIVDSENNLLEGDSEFHFSILPGDGNRSGEVNNRDIQELRSVLLANIGEEGYSPFYDYDGSGSVDIRDVQVLRDHLLETLPGDLALEFSVNYFDTLLESKTSVFPPTTQGVAAEVNEIIFSELSEKSHEIELPLILEDDVVSIFKSADTLSHRSEKKELRISTDWIIRLI